MAGHSDDEGADYWPGYVDALTAMVKLLAFVMMLLAVMVFTLSQKISQESVKAIAAAADIEVKPDSNMEDVAKQIAAKLQAVGLGPKRTKPTTDMPPRETPPIATPEPAPPREAPPPELPKAEPMKDVAPKDSTPASPIRSGEIEAATRDKDLRMERSTTAERNGGALVVKFLSRHSAMDEETVKSLRAYLAAQPPGVQYEVRANADGSGGALSDMRRVSYYRAMQIRQVFLDAGIAKEQISIRVTDVVNEDEGRAVRVTARKGGG